MMEIQKRRNVYFLNVIYVKKSVKIDYEGEDYVNDDHDNGDNGVR